MSGDLVERLRESGSRSEVELHEDREEAADRIEELEAQVGRVTVSEAARVLDVAIGKNQVPQKVLDIFNAGMPVTALRAIQEQSDAL